MIRNDYFNQLPSDLSDVRQVFTWSLASAALLCVMHHASVLNVVSSLIRVIEFLVGVLTVIVIVTAAVWETDGERLGECVGSLRQGTRA
jgi:hypothetical protein